MLNLMEQRSPLQKQGRVTPEPRDTLFDHATKNARSLRSAEERA